MIQSFRHKGLRRFYKSVSLAGIRLQRARRLTMQLAALDSAQSIEDMDIPARTEVDGRFESTGTGEMALRLSKCLGRTPANWLAMQESHDLWRAKQRVDLSGVAKARLTAA